MGYDDSSSRLAPIIVGAVIGMVAGVAGYFNAQSQAGGVSLPLALGGGALVGAIAGFGIAVKGMVGGGILGTLVMVIVLLVAVIGAAIGMAIVM